MCPFVPIVQSSSIRSIALRTHNPFCKLRKPVTGGSNNEDVDPEAPASCRTVSFDASRETHYVIVVHGTFDAPPDDGSRTWYQPAAPGEINFCSKIGARLAEGPLGGGCVWRELPAEPPARFRIPYPFHWDGTNTHEGRIDAAHKLARLLDVIANGDPSARIHVIAHSHGGNVLLKAIELYMKRQGSKAVSDLPPPVLQRFWAAYKGRYDLIRHWKKPDVSNTLWRFFPFLVVRRSMAGRREGRTKEQYPWASQRWLDSLLRLPAQRQRLFLAHRLATSPLSNALGGLVFLGTPFYMKSWERNGMLLLLATTAVSVGVTFVVMWGYVLLWRVIVLAIAGQLSRTTTPSYLPFSLAAAVLIFAIISVALELWRSTAFYSGNLYHAPGFDWSHAMSALVIHAGKLDEASLALSTEPIARAYIFPQLASMLKLPFWKPLPRRPVTRKCSDWTLYISNAARILIWNVIFILPALAVALLSRVLAPVVISMVRNVIVTVSFGLSAKELSFASVFVDEHLHLGLASQHIEHWNVQKLLALAKTRSLQGELMEGYEDDTCDMGEALFGDGLPEEGLPREGITGTKGERRAEGGEEGGDEGGDGKGKRAGGGVSAAEGVGSASEAVKGKQQQDEHLWVMEETGTGSRHGSGSTAGMGRQGSGSGEERLVYSFLWDDRVLEAAARECEMYKLLRPQLHAITHSPHLSDQECVRQVKQLCVMIEERFGELTGRFDLNHGAYFRDPRIIGAMVHFLGHRELPDWSREIDTDVLRAEERIRFGRLGERGDGGY
ncbi:unnamed protein product [Closterium sp. Yama58-4]|nr:unnamed protein product [Closterium sp. Yama58-4]